MSGRDLIVVPRDGMFLKAGHGWQTSASGRARSLDWPPPRTLRGALRTAFGRAWEAQEGRTLSGQEWHEHTGEVALGLSLPVHRAGARGNWECAWPVPFDCFYRPNRKDVKFEVVEQILPEDRRHGGIRVLGAADPDPWDAMWWPRFEQGLKPEKPPRWWSHTAFMKWLQGKKVGKSETRRTRDEVDLYGPDPNAPPDSRPDVHVGIDPETFAAKESVLFSYETVEPISAARREWGIAAKVSFPADARTVMQRPLTIGGKRKLCSLEAGEGVFPRADDVAAAFEAKPVPGLRLILVTPAHFARGWLPDGFERKGDEFRGQLDGVGDLILRAAYVDRPDHVSGWEMVPADGGEPHAKRTDRLVRRGSVYFFTKPGGKAFTPGDASALWLAALGRNQNEGLGVVVPGVWDFKDSLSLAEVKP